MNSLGESEKDPAASPAGRRAGRAAWGTADPQDRAAMRGGVVAWVDEMEGRGILQPGGHELRPASHGRTVRVRGGEALISDGPFAETKEQIGGFDVLECASLDEALEVAGKHPVARFGAIDLRPFWQE